MTIARMLLVFSWISFSSRTNSRALGSSSGRLSLVKIFQTALMFDTWNFVAMFTGRLSEYPSNSLMIFSTSSAMISSIPFLPNPKSRSVLRVNRRCSSHG